MKKHIMSTFKGAHYIVFFIVIFFLIFIAYAGKIFTVFTVKEHFSDKVLFKRIVKVGDILTLDYIHSVTNQPVYEVFEVQTTNTLNLVEMRYDSFGANLPVGPEKLVGETTQFIVEDGFYKILYESRQFDKVPLRVGQVVANHKLVFSDGSKLRLLDIAKGGAFIEFFVEPLY